MGEWITKEAACRAVAANADTCIVAGNIEADTAAIVDAIRALPAPEPVGEEELVEKIGDAIEDALISCHLDETKSADQIQDIAARAALSVVRAHDRREADEVREVLLEVLDVVGLALPAQVMARATRAAKVTP